MMDEYGYEYGMPNECMGVYTAQNQFDFDPVMLSSLGFNPMEIQTLSFIVMNEGKATVNSMVQHYGIPYEQAKKLKYMFDICTGRVLITSQEDLSKHLRKMFGQHKRVGIQDLAVSRIGEIPRKAVVSGIPEKSSFSIWNSIKYPFKERMYTVVDVTQTNIIIETDRKPTLKFKEPKVLEGIAEIKSGPVNGKITVAINRKYCRLCNRFVIVGSMRRPEFHNGMVEIICIEGTKVYVFADTVSAKKYSRYGTTTQRVYDYGFFPSEIHPKLMSCASSIYKRLCGVYASPVAANSDFQMIADDEPEEAEDEIDIE